MTGSELDYVRDTVDQESFNYAFRYYSDFSEIEDEDFHLLREAYVKAASDLELYLGL